MGNIFVEYESKFAFDETIEILSEIISNSGWKILIDHDLQATLKNKGIDVLPVTVIELCNPKYSSQILKESELRIYSSMMPCRISVYEKTNGKTYLSTINSEILSLQIGGVVQHVMTEAFKDTRTFISLVI
jgi:uncharacterized protein (DUF302 family)